MTSFNKIDSSLNLSSLLSNALNRNQSSSTKSTNLVSPLLTNSSEDTQEIFTISSAQISKTASILSQQKSSFANLSINVIDTTNAIETANYGIAQGLTLLRTLEDTLEQVQDPDTPEDTLTQLTQTIQDLLAEYTDITESTTYNGESLLQSDKTQIVDTSKGNKLKVHFSDLSLEKLGLTDLDTSSSKAIDQSSKLVSKAIDTLEKSFTHLDEKHENLLQVADHFANILTNILNFENDLGFSTTDLDSLNLENMSQAQDTTDPQYLLEQMHQLNQ